MLAAGLVSVVLGCGGRTSLNAGSSESEIAGVTVPGGFDVVELIAGLDGPTQMAFAPDGRLLVAELAGSEGAAVGRVLAFDPVSWATDAATVVDATVLFDGLDKPTGLAVADGRVWVMEKRSLSSGSLDGGGLTIVLDDLPYNGRSEGTLTTTPDGDLLYNTSGSISGGEVVADSGVLWSLAPDGGSPVRYATGFKHAYARTFDADGRLWQTEMSDGSYDGQAAADELVEVEAGDDFGWPRCVDDRRAVTRYGGTDEICRRTPRSTALFEPGATPVAVAVAPWDPQLLLVALWNRAMVVSVSIEGEVDEPGPGAPFLGGLDHPQDLLVDGDRLLVTDHESGRVLAVSRAG